MHTNTFCKYKKNYSHRLACILFLLRRKLPYVVTRDVCPSVRLSVRPSSVEISLERGSKRSAEPIDLKICLDMDN